MLLPRLLFDYILCLIFPDTRNCNWSDFFYNILSVVHLEFITKKGKTIITSLNPSWEYSKYSSFSYESKNNNVHLISLNIFIYRWHQFHQFQHIYTYFQLLISSSVIHIPFLLVNLSTSNVL